jgi:hypothetical protein
VLYKCIIVCISWNIKEIIYLENSIFQLQISFTVLYGLEIEDFHSQINGAHEQIAESSCDCMPLARIQPWTGCVEQRPYDCHSSIQEILAFQGT